MLNYNVKPNFEASITRIADRYSNCDHTILHNAYTYAQTHIAAMVTDQTKAKMIVETTDNFFAIISRYGCHRMAERRLAHGMYVYLTLTNGPIFRKLCKFQFFPSSHRPGKPDIIQCSHCMHALHSVPCIEPMCFNSSAIFRISHVYVCLVLEMAHSIHSKAELASKMVRFGLKAQKNSLVCSASHQNYIYTVHNYISYDKFECHLEMCRSYFWWVVR